MTSRARLLRRRAGDAMIRAASLAERAEAGDSQAAQASDLEVIVARVLLEFAQIEEDLELEQEA